MHPKIDKARKYVAIWGESANLLKDISTKTGRTQVELIYDAIRDLDAKVEREAAAEREETTYAR